MEKGGSELESLISYAGCQHESDSGEGKKPYTEKFYTELLPNLHNLNWAVIQSSPMDLMKL